MKWALIKERMEWKDIGYNEKLKGKIEDWQQIEKIMDIGNKN